MSTAFFFITKDQIEDGKIRIEGESYKHLIKVLRAKPGERVLCSDREWLYETGLEEISGRTAVLAVKNREKIENPKPAVDLFFGLLKGKKQDLVVRQAAELGAGMIVPVKFERSVSTREAGKEDRWQKLALEAARLSKRGLPPEVLPALSFKEFLTSLKAYKFVLLFDEEERKSVMRPELVGNPDKIAVIVGPEGGFTRAEVKDIQKAGAVTVSLGRYIFKVETAVTAALALTLYEAGRLR